MDLFEKYYILTVRLLTRRPRSVHELQEYLSKKKAAPDVINAIIAKLQEQRFQSDREFALWWVDQRTRFRAKSDRVIKLELRQKGIADALINEVFAQPRQGTQSDKEKALIIAQKYSKRLQHLSKQEKYIKLGGYLSRRGFDWDIIKRTIDDII